MGHPGCTGGRTRFYGWGHQSCQLTLSTNGKDLFSTFIPVEDVLIQDLVQAGCLEETLDRQQCWALSSSASAPRRLRVTVYLAFQNV